MHVCPLHLNWLSVTAAYNFYPLINIWNEKGVSCYRNVSVHKRDITHFMIDKRYKKRKWGSLFQPEGITLVAVQPVWNNAEHSPMVFQGGILKVLFKIKGDWGGCHAHRVNRYIVYYFCFMKEMIHAKDLVSFSIFSTVYLSRHQILFPIQNQYVYSTLCHFCHKQW